MGMQEQEGGGGGEGDRVDKGKDVGWRRSGPGQECGLGGGGGGE